MRAIVVAGPDAWDVVEKLVRELLTELGEEGRELGTLSPRVRTLWEARPNLMSAVIAFGDDGEPIGVLTLSEGFAIYANGLYGTIFEMYVVPQARSSGVGHRLIERAVEIGHERSWSRIDVTAPESAAWDRTVRFYRSCGFAPAGPKLKKPL